MQVRGAGREEGQVEFAYPDGARVRLTHADAPSLLAEVAARLEAGQGFALATLNVDHLEKLGREAGFRAAYAAHDLVVADGNPVVWLSRLSGRPVGLVPGSDLVVPLVRAATAAGVGVALIGGRGESLVRAAARLGREVPGARIVLTHAPGFPFDPTGAEAEAVADRISRSGAGLCLLALGAPRQEIFAAFARRRLPGVGFASIGAGLDFLAGDQRRAPRLVRRARMEWLWRMLSDPRRLAGRYARGFMILPGHARRAWRSRHRRSP
ncbi:WecB/TagA/CpsF family glycosyltransferase [Paracoccus sanguinis]|nr:WecB/TagA/CpsF family glycosyltransferase [Paracoccus sanguinis]